MKFTDIETDKMKVTELRAIIQAMESDRGRIEEWVKSKENEWNAFEARAERTRNELIELRKKADSEKKDLENKKLEFSKDYEKLSKDLSENRALDSENKKNLSDIDSKLNILKSREDAIDSKDIELTRKLNKWNEIREQFYLIK